jgi:hypothetical protein
MLSVGTAGLGRRNDLSLERVAVIIGLAAQTPYSKQALHQRLSPQLEQFLAYAAASLFAQLAAPLNNRGWFAAFPRILLPDSTVEPLPDHLADAFPGPANGRKRRQAALKQNFYETLAAAGLCLGGRQCDASGQRWVTDQKFKSTVKALNQNRSRRHPATLEPEVQMD